MATTAVPAFMKRLVADMKVALPNNLVSLGYPTSLDDADSLMVGIVDPLAESALTAATSDLSWATTGVYADVAEAGTVTCAVLVRTGDDDMAVSLNRATAILAAVESWARNATDTSLGIATLLDAHVSRTEWTPYSTETGDEFLLVFDVAFNAYLPAS